MNLGAVDGEMSVTPAASTGRMSTIRRTRWSRIPWIGKSVSRVRANSLSTRESRASLTGTFLTPGMTSAGSGR